MDILVDCVTCLGLMQTAKLCAEVLGKLSLSNQQGWELDGIEVLNCEWHKLAKSVEFSPKNMRARARDFQYQKCKKCSALN